MNHLMIDLETLGSTSNAPIATIGAVFFEPMTGCHGKTFYRNIDFVSDIKLGANPDGETIKWWLKQSEQARGELILQDAISIAHALTELNVFIADNQTPKGKNSLQVWGNGASFDCVILRNAYTRANIMQPWNWWNDRDVRTIVEIGLDIGFNPKNDDPFQGVRHNALDDAIHQANYVAQIWQLLTKNKS